MDNKMPAEAVMAQRRWVLCVVWIPTRGFTSSPGGIRTVLFLLLSPPLRL